MADLETRVTALETRVQELQSRNEIQELRFRYFMAPLKEGWTGPNKIQMVRK